MFLRFIILLFALSCSAITFAATSEQNIKQAYYQGTGGKEGAELRLALNNLIKKQKVFSYKELWQQLEYTDEDPENNENIMVIYAGKSVPKNFRVGGAGGNQEYAWNREHLWPKSHGFKNENQTAYTDLHHIRPSFRIINEKRGNKDFAFVAAPTLTIEGNHIGKVSFEPADSVKRDIARMMMYMDVRYEGNDISRVGDLQLVDKISTTGNQLGKICDLLSWHYQDPVAEMERVRNQRIYERQQNRNPFIDYPAWATSLYQQQCPIIPVIQAMHGQEVINQHYLVLDAIDSVIHGQMLTENEDVTISWQVSSDYPEHIIFHATNGPSALIRTSSQVTEAFPVKVKLVIKDNKTGLQAETAKTFIAPGPSAILNML